MSITSQIRYVRALDSTATDGSGKTGLAYSDITAKYLVHGGTLTSLTTEDISTLGTYQAPTSNAHIRIKEVNSADPTKGAYEVHFHNDQVAAAGKKLWLFLSASGAAFAPLEVDLLPYADLNATNAANLASAASNYSATRGLSGTALPAAAADAAGGLPISDAGGLDLDAKIGPLTFTVANVLDANTLRLGGTVQTARDIGASVLLSSGTGTGQVTLASGSVLANLRNGAHGGDSATLELSSGSLGNLSMASFSVATDVVIGGTFSVVINDLPWNANWDADVQSEVDDALIAKGLDHLVFTSVSGTDIADNSIIAKLASKSATADWDSYDNTTDAMEANRDNIGTAGAGLTNINLPDQTMNITGDITGNLSGSVGNVTGAVGSVTGNVGGNVTGSVGSLATQAKADVNAEIVDALATDTYAEPGQGNPAATTSLAAKIGYLFKAWRNKKTKTATASNLYADDGTTIDQKTTDSDDGTTATRGEQVSGP